ncbi:FAD-dependent oxidoreductase [Allorhizobium sp. NPDC080224]|uniref:FAD-dependent oxidoreductase n=1 Tax=Allorhizobium sp. NPDC080224 TaxID=3390547 RepID=UPI003CFE5605
MDNDDKRETIDCAVIGGGPAGLTAALHLARYQLKVTVFDDESSRAAAIPMSHNVPGFPKGYRVSICCCACATMPCAMVPGLPRSR